MDTSPLTQRPQPSFNELPANNLTAAQLQNSEPTQTLQAVPAMQQAEPVELADQQLQQMAEQMESFIGTFTHELKFRVDEDSGRNVVTVIDSQSGDTIRQIPTEELLEVITRLAEASSGLIDVKA